MDARRLVVVALVVVAGSAGFVAAQPDRVLVVEDADTGDRLLTVPVEDGSTVTLTYTHSVEKTPVEDVYTVDGTRLDNSLMRFESYGWGLPAREDVRLEDGWFVFDPDRTYDEFYVKPGRIAGHTLTVDGETYDLVELSNASSVRIAVERRSPLPAFQVSS
ncbi:DUF1850 domain-containing protein [Halorarius litoreus]|uniref:DUF1850 domain-containing protein n=1 Tax=Halorarius litoreus TaxID=2962676 RepID=UPI0020CDCB80|nr:DUF1850 domain-containing protein [Halorarius litoreus]